MPKNNPIFTFRDFEVIQFWLHGIAKEFIEKYDKTELTRKIDEVINAWDTDAGETVTITFHK